MAFDPVSAVADLIKTGLDKWLPDANQKEQLKAEIDNTILDFAYQEAKESWSRT